MFVKGSLTEWTTGQVKPNVVMAYVVTLPGLQNLPTVATIDWGDQSPIATAVATSAQCYFGTVCVFAVTGTHVYASADLFRPTITVTIGGQSAVGVAFAEVAAPVDLLALGPYLANLWQNVPVGVLAWYDPASPGPNTAVNRFCTGTVVGHTSTVVTSARCFGSLSTKVAFSGEMALNGTANFQFEPGNTWPQPCTSLLGCGPNPSEFWSSFGPRIFESGDVAFVVMGTGSTVSTGTAPVFLHFGAATGADWGVVGFPVQTSSWKALSCISLGGITSQTVTGSLAAWAKLPCDTTSKAIAGVWGAPFATLTNAGVAIGGVMKDTCTTTLCNPCDQCGELSSGGPFVFGTYLDEQARVTASWALLANFPTISSDWTQYSHDLAGSDFNARESGLPPAIVSNLRVRWADNGNAAGASAQPIVYNGQVYWGDWGGVLHATPITGPTAGQDSWTTGLGVTAPPASSKCDPPLAGIASTPALGFIQGAPTLYLEGGGNDPVGNGEVFLYAVNAVTGGITWRRPIDSVALGGFGWSSPVLYNGSVYIGTSSFGDCPLEQGRVIRIDATTGAVQNTFCTVPDSQVGGGIWGSPTIDVERGMLFVNTGTPAQNATVPSACGQSSDYSMSILELDATNLSLIDHWRVPSNEEVTDGDFGNVPTLFTASLAGVTVPMVGTGNKNGYWYAFNRLRLSTGPLWEVRVSDVPQPAGANPRVAGSISPAVWDGATLYVGAGQTTIGSTTYPGGIRALDPATGSVIWETGYTEGAFIGSLVASPGVLYGAATLWSPSRNTGVGTILGINAANGTVLFRFTSPSGTPYWSPPTPAEGLLFALDMSGTLDCLG